MKRALLALLPLGLALMPLAATADGRPSVGVADFDNAAGHLSWWYQGAGRDLAASLSRQLTATGAFSVMDRVEVAEAQSARSDVAVPREAVGGTAGEVAQTHFGPRYLIRPVVSFYRESRSSRGSRFRIKGVNLRARGHSAEIAVDLEVVDLTNGSTLYRDTIDTRAAGMEVGVGYYQPELSGELSRYRGKPAGKAIAKVVTKLSREIECLITSDGSCGL